MVRNYKRKTDKEYAWKIPRSRTWDAKKPKVEKQMPPEFDPSKDWNGIMDWNGEDETDDGYPLEDCRLANKLVLEWCRKNKIIN